MGVEVMITNLSNEDALAYAEYFEHAMGHAQSLADQLECRAQRDYWLGQATLVSREHPGEVIA